jgi:hypothetical protein
MNLTTHFVFIPGILFLLFITYIAFFKDLAKKHWEFISRFASFMPGGFRLFSVVFKTIVIVALVLTIAFYIQALKGEA